MKNTINQAFTEVYDVINHMEIEMQEKIPKKFIDLIRENRDLDYKLNINYKEDIKKQLLKESKVILSLIYRDFLCSKEKKEKLLQLDLEEIRKEEKILTEVIDLYRADTFEELFENLYNDKEEIEKKVKGMYKIYSPEKEKEYGVLGICIKLT